MDTAVIVVVFVSVVTGVILVTAVLLRRQLDAAIKEITRLSQRLVKIEERLDMSEESDEQTAAHSFAHPKGEGIPMEASKINRKRRSADLSSMSDKELYQYISNVIKEDELFRWPDFNRSAVMEQFSLSAARVGAVFARGGGQSLPEFVRSCRLDYACRLMVENPRLSFTEIGESAGFQRTTTFYHDFRARFGMAPAEYRKMKLNSEVSQ